MVDFSEGSLTLADMDDIIIHKNSKIWKRKTHDFVHNSINMLETMFESSNPIWKYIHYRTQNQRVD